MMKTKTLVVLTLACWLVGGCFVLGQENAALRAARAKTSDKLEFFEKQVRPLLIEHCYECHSGTAERIEGSLRLDSLQGHLSGGDSGPAIVPGDPQESLLVESIRYESYEMPPQGKLPTREIEILETWVAMGAPWPDEAPPADAKESNEFNLNERKEQFWLWQPVTRPPLPQVNDESWPQSDIDRFILSQLEAAGLKPAPDADATALLRRLHFDLVGLPPSREEVLSFMATTNKQQALEAAVDRLLDSPHFGERWGRHWLDLVRYAESRGHEFDNDTDNAFQYRDYVIRALNADVPYDQFVKEHIAGDLLESPRLHPEKHFNESVLGTGFWFLGEWVHSPVDIRKDESDRFDNMLDVMSKTFLGVTVACARCHDHKFDAISTADYYSLSGFLQSSDYRQVRFESMQQNKSVADRLAKVDQKYQSQILDFLAQQGCTPPSQAGFIDDPSIVFDFSNLPQNQFMQDGYIFGSSPRMAARAYLDNHGTVRVASHSSAANDPIWVGLESITQGAIQNQSALARLPRSGRTLRTPTFELQAGDVSCLVDGIGHIVACVDSHRLVAGPLHKETIVSVKQGQRWVRLNLNRYIGHRLHLEFVPAKAQQLAVRMVTQGLDAEGLKQIDERLARIDHPFKEFSDTAEAILNAGNSTKVEEQVFADFESGTYTGWTKTGDAFGEIPQTLETIADYQGKINGVGTYFVNSHNIRPGGDVRRGDSLTGTLTSAEFVIDFERIEFLVGGGNHVGRTCVNLLVDGNVALSVTGKANNQMSLNTWDVRPFKGKRAKIEIVDNHQTGWGNIGVDHIVFQKTLSNESTTSSQPTEADRKPWQRTSLRTPAQELIRAWRREREDQSKQIIRKSHLAMAMMDGTGEDDRILIRGNSSKPGNVEPRHFLTAISGSAPMQIASGSGRLELAEHINDPQNPLASRVIVNRLWHHLMGRGIVATVDDFGVLGQRPTHPELLDHLATTFLENGRSLKAMIKKIVLSRSYQMSSHAASDALQADPTNKLWHHCPPRRLQGEVIRDALLSLAGRLDPQAYGPPVPIHLTPFMDGRGRPKKSGPRDGNGRRSIYVAVRRNFLSPFMLTFDTPVPFSSMGRRNVSNVPAQALIMLNDPLVKELSQAWAQSTLDQIPGDSDEAARDRIEHMYFAGFARPPISAERQAAFEYLTAQAKQLNCNLDSPTLWADFAHVLVNAKEFIFLR